MFMNFTSGKLQVAGSIVSTYKLWSLFLWSVQLNQYLAFWLHLYVIDLTFTLAIVHMLLNSQAPCMLCVFWTKKNWDTLHKLFFSQRCIYLCMCSIPGIGLMLNSSLYVDELKFNFNLQSNVKTGLTTLTDRMDQNLKIGSNIRHKIKVEAQILQLDKVFKTRK